MDSLVGYPVSNPVLLSALPLPSSDYQIFESLLSPFMLNSTPVTPAASLLPQYSSAGIQKASHQSNPASLTASPEARPERTQPRPTPAKLDWLSEGRRRGPESKQALRAPFARNRAKLDTEGCGKAPLNNIWEKSRIIGGKVADIGSWPWIVSLQLPYEKKFVHVCGGCLIAKRWILTAAHCIKISSDPDLWRAVIGTNILYQKQTKMMEVQEIIVHPNFMLENYLNDVALFHLKKAMTYNDYIQPICLPFGVFQNLDQNTACYISGWGLTKEKGNTTTALQEAQVHFISRAVCNSMNSYAGLIPNSSFCAGDEDGKFDTCRGDSGGPLMCYLPEHEQFFAMGITSYGLGCGRKNFPGVYSGLSFHKNWLLHQLNQQVISHFIVTM
ncbi:transmembrane protease serine 12 [Sorex araneus]|uniref:transmembrane protease serine 12 n=1 Tax=Sorex araneus TaxID=42254 RepID=UPI002433586E|nr:transmembrane protease serine 12 [Sorex araneus]